MGRRMAMLLFEIWNMYRMCLERVWDMLGRCLEMLGKYCEYQCRISDTIALVLVHSLGLYFDTPILCSDIQYEQVDFPVTRATL